MGSTSDDRAVALAAGSAVIALGALFTAAGMATWTAIASSLRKERIVVADDARHFAGAVVDSPWTAMSEVEVIARHTDEITDGRTFAELDRHDPRRQTAMTGSLLRSALLTSVIGFGVAAAAAGVGVALAAVGYGLRASARR